MFLPFIKKVFNRFFRKIQINLYQNFIIFPKLINYLRNLTKNNLEVSKVAIIRKLKYFTVFLK